MTNREEQIIGCIVTCANVSRQYLQQSDIVLDEKMKFYINNIASEKDKAGEYLKYTVDKQKLISSVRSKLGRFLGDKISKFDESQAIEVTRAEIDLYSVLEPAVSYLEEFVEKSKTAGADIKYICRKVICDWNLFVDYVAEGAR